jgi:hypothetical protein
MEGRQCRRNYARREAQRRFSAPIEPPPAHLGIDAEAPNAPKLSEEQLFDYRADLRDQRQRLPGFDNEERDE